MPCALSENGCFFLSRMKEVAEQDFAATFTAYVAWCYPNLTPDEIEAMLGVSREHKQAANTAAQQFANGDHCEECTTFASN